MLTMTAVGAVGVGGADREAPHLTQAVLLESFSA